MLQRAKKVLTICGCLLPIVLFFAAALYPVFSMVHENAHASVCQSNLRQLAVAFIEYSQDNDQAMPNIADKNGRNTWREAVYPYSPPSKDIYHCPDRYDNLDSHGFSQNYAANYSGNYGQSQPDQGRGALAGPNSRPLTQSDYPHPNQLILLVEAENNNRPEFNIDNAALFGPQANKLWAGHFSVHSDFLMADGHAKSLPPSATYRDDPKNKTLFNFWYRNCETRLSANGVTVLKETTTRFHW